MYAITVTKLTFYGSVNSVFIYKYLHGNQSFKHESLLNTW